MFVAGGMRTCSLSGSFGASGNMVELLWGF
jgi:hypothetical protein